VKDVSTESWKRIDAILDGALDLSPKDRSRYLDEQCGDDAELRSRVEAMLGAGEVAGGFLENNAPPELAEMKKAVRKVADKAEDTLSGTHAGPYRLIRPIGAGGMGQVYLGMRDDQSYTRYVAVKVIRRGMDTDEILHRFRMERRILASLSHPNIASLLDGGATEEGLSYFVMEYIEGEPITEYCDSRTMPIRERLKLFSEVCSAVQFAHQNLIVHRDLKPSNILVTPEGVPKLLDFGIAKVLNPNLAGYTVPMTEAGVRVMTPDYASPEQMRGGVVTTASDVYQLGILLYELLTGARPHKTEGRSRMEIEKLVLNAEPDRPSTAISQVSRDIVTRRTQRKPADTGTGKTAVERLRKLLSGDLDRMVLMALRKEPDRRYASVDVFKEDIRRYLDGMPVSAQADTFGYRASKFIRRHKFGVAASVGLVLLLVAVTFMAVRFAVITSAQSERIALAAAKTEQVSRFLVSTFEWADPEYSRGRDITVVELMDRAVLQIDQELAGQPELQSHMLMELGIAYREMGKLQESARLLQRALAMRRADPGTPPLDLAASLFELGVLMDWEGEYTEAEPLLAEALEIRRKEAGENDPLVAASLNGLAAILAYTGRYDESEPMLREALRIQQAAFSEGNRDISETLSNLGWVMQEKGIEEGNDQFLREAEDSYRSTLDMQRRLLGQDHPHVASSLNNLGALLEDTGRFEEAESVHRDAYALRLKLFGEDHSQVANSISHLGRALYGQGKLDEAEPLFRETLSRHLEQLGTDHPYVGRDRFVLASLLLDKKEYAEAEQLLTEALRVYRLELPADHPWVAQARETLSTVYTSWGREDRSALF
jgi:eukaryotic-like serine/threonine-protein kinase